MKRFSLLLLFLLLALALPFHASAAVIHFDEFGTDPLLDANGINVSGVTFAFAPGQSTYNSSIGTDGNTMLVSDPLLTGPTSQTLFLTFDFPIDVLQFDVVLLSMDQIQDAYLVSLSNGALISGDVAPQPGGVY